MAMDDRRRNLGDVRLSSRLRHTPGIQRNGGRFPDTAVQCTASSKLRRFRSPQVFAATYWTERKGPCKVVVFSNCDQVQLWLDGRKVASRKPDDGPDTLYGDYDAGGNPWDGGNCRHLAHPPVHVPGRALRAG